MDSFEHYRRFVNLTLLVLQQLHGRTTGTTATLATTSTTRTTSTTAPTRTTANTRTTATSATTRTTATIRTTATTRTTATIRTTAATTGTTVTTGTTRTTFILPTNVLNNPGRALEIGANIGSAAVSRNPKAALSTIPDVIKFYHTGKGLYLGKFV